MATTYDVSLVGEMREWIEDIGFSTSRMSLFDVIRFIRREYGGGIDQFIADSA